MRYLIVLLLLSFAESAVAQPTCDAVPTINPTTANKYKINFDNIHLVGDGISALEALRSV